MTLSPLLEFIKTFYTELPKKFEARFNFTVVYTQGNVNCKYSQNNVRVKIMFVK